MATFKSEKKQVRTFGFGLAVLFAVFGTISFYRHDWTGLPWHYGVSVVTLVISCTVPVVLWPICKAALFLAHILGWLNTRVFLGFLFYFVFTPVALAFRLFGKDPLARRLEKDQPTYWILRDLKTPRDPAHWERQF